MRGGKRIGAGAKPGSKKAIKDGSLVKFAPKVAEVVQKLLESEDKDDQKWVVKELLPYVFRKQPQEIKGEDDETLDVIEVVVRRPS